MPLASDQEQPPAQGLLRLALVTVLMWKLLAPLTGRPKVHARPVTAIVALGDRVAVLQAYEADELHGDGEALLVLPDPAAASHFWNTSVRIFDARTFHIVDAEGLAGIQARMVELLEVVASCFTPFTRHPGMESEPFADYSWLSHETSLSKVTPCSS